LYVLFRVLRVLCLLLGEVCLVAAVLVAFDRLLVLFMIAMPMILGMIIKIVPRNPPGESRGRRGS
jgi:hypothetical protein